ncbi:hypothetical protein DJ73_06250 [Halorubrum sp. Ea1]|uniref:glycosyltransferase family 2 protein n=1 Tax=Halorubrum sp. Ea1 TaxID=1480718 RepID=UPI000B987D24|nr:glycosyltransferase family 2 protein [Halorubrum sp. Ea1]OYR53897.1 hypothetical protein DJ73_06250 [Halorubrum sp. Ea1]
MNTVDMVDNPLVSVIIPTYNRREELERAIDSVLHQSFAEFELIVVDDNSMDDTTNLVKGYEDNRIRYFRHKQNEGVSQARNTGIQHAKGEYIAFLDSDDEWVPEKLETQLKVIESMECLGVYTNASVKRSSYLRSIYDFFFHGKPLTGCREELIVAQLSFNGFVHAGSTLLVERELCEMVGGFPEELHRYEDLSFVINCLKHGDFKYIDKELTILHDTGTAHPKDKLSAIEEFRVGNHELIEDYDRRGYPITEMQDIFIAQQHLALNEYGSAFEHLHFAYLLDIRTLIVILYYTIRRKSS